MVPRSEHNNASGYSVTVRTTDNCASTYLPIMTMNRHALGVIIGLGLLLTPVARAQNQPNAPDRTINVSGEGTVRVAPDMATVRFGIVTEADDPEVARKQNAEAASAAMNAVRDLGIPKERIQLETLQLQPKREYDPETRQYKEKGFEAVRQVSVEVHDLEQLPTLVARVVQQGANRLQGIEYDLQDRTDARNDALRAAAMNAREKAQLLAETVGVQLGAVRSISEQSLDFPRPVFRATLDMAKAEASQAAPEPDAYSAGEIEVKANVQVVFDLVTGQ